MPQLDKDTCVIVPLFIIISNIFGGIINCLWFPGEVANALVIAGGASAIFYLFLAKSDEERSLSLFAWLANNLIIFYCLDKPDLCCFLVCICFILLASLHLWIFFGPNVLFHSLFYAVLLYRSFFHHQMGEWGFGLVTELVFISFLLNRQKPQSDKFLYLLPIWCIVGTNLHVNLHLGAAEIGIHVLFLAAGAAIVFLLFMANTFNEITVSFSIYIIINLLIGNFLTTSLSYFISISSIFLITNVLFIFFFYLKGKRSSRSLEDTLLSNNREGSKTLLVIYFLVLGFLLSQLNPESIALPLCTNWFLGLGIQVGFLTALNYFFEGESKPSCKSQNQNKYQNAHSPLDQFSIVPFYPIQIGRLYFSFTNASFFLLVTLSFVLFYFHLVTKKGGGKLVPNAFQSVLELIYDFVLNLVNEQIGGLSGNVKQPFFPCILVTFTFLLFCNLQGMIPYSFTVTSHFIVTLGLSFSLFIGITIVGFVKNGLHFLSFLLPAGVPLPLAPFLVLLELISYCFRALSLGIRLFANMMAGHSLVKILSGFAWTMLCMNDLFYFIGSTGPFFIVLALTGLELGVAILQAYVFTILICIYLNDAINLH